MKKVTKILIIGSIIWAGLIAGTYMVLDKIHDNRIEDIISTYNAELDKLSHERDTLKVYSDSVNIVLNKYKALADSFAIVDETHKVEIDRLNIKLIEALEEVFEATPDDNYTFLQERFITTDTLEYEFSGEQVTNIAAEIIQGDFDDVLLMEYMAMEDALREQLTISKETMKTLITDRRELGLLVQELYDQAAIRIQEGQLKDEEITRLKKALRMWRAGSLGAGAFVILVLLLV